ncbi:hypothetical protein C6361_19510 [Plantactinospora sp. BC1]|uniref:hypothetical protein n=1 Tax=Plantactinospora sp. BC1 TaxID=2108470 RepID=UPI000D16501D|nr:hypothetical protein [Plantactinospora sp. BC1]AVT31306.1 hypothetical protein C6361_19510 [Plantactinospora sp. BC1]
MAFCVGGGGRVAAAGAVADCAAVVAWRRLRGGGCAAVAARRWLRGGGLRGGGWAAAAARRWLRGGGLRGGGGLRCAVADAVAQTGQLDSL